MKKRSRQTPFKFIHTSDWHLGAPKGWGSNDTPGCNEWVEVLRNLHEKAVETIIREAIREDVDVILVAGDITDLYFAPERELVERTDAFLREKVVKPLAKNNIKIVMTPGTHDCKSKVAINLLLSIMSDFQPLVQLVVPLNPGKLFTEKKLKGLGTLFTGLGSSAVCDSLTISCDEVHQGVWIELQHLQSEALYKWYSNHPVYRAFGDRHVIGRENGCYFPGAPLVRSSACDAPTEVGPRYCLIYSVGDLEPTALKLNVPEIALLEKTTVDEYKWKLTYDRHQDTKPYEGRLKDVLKTVWNEHEAIFFVTIGVLIGDCVYSSQYAIHDELKKETRIVWETGSKRYATVRKKSFLESSAL